MDMENKSAKKIINLKFLGMAVLSLLLILIFLSRTIYNYNLPVVTAVSPENGNLSKIELTTGIVKYENVSVLYSEVSGTVDKILVRDGDVVSKGQPLLAMRFEHAIEDTEKQIKSLSEDTQNTLSHLQNSREKLLVDIEKISTNINNTQRKIDELKQEIYKQESVSDYELIQCESNMSKAEEELEKSKALFDAGVISRQELTNAEQNLENYRNMYENAKRIMTENLGKSADAVADKEASRQTQLKDYTYQLETYKQDLKSKTLDLDANAAQEAACASDGESMLADLRETLADYEKNAVICAAEDSFVISMDVNKGEQVNAYQQIASLGLAEGFIVDCEVDLNNNFVMTGDSCVLGNSSHSFNGVVAKVTPAEHAKIVTIAIQSDAVTAGETFDIRFEKVSSERYTLVPNGAVNRDSDGYFLKLVKRRDGIVGKEYYTEKLSVYIGDSDSENTIIVKGIVFFEPIVLISDKPFSEGETIKLQNESDFFEE